MRVFLVSSWLLVCFIALPVLCMTQNATGQDDLRWKLKEMEEVIRSQQEQIQSIRSSIKSIEAPTKGGNDFNVYWDKGLRFKSEDGNFKLKIGGRIMNDCSWFSENSAVKRVIGDQVDGTEFRRARIFLSGDIRQKMVHLAV